MTKRRTMAAGLIVAAMGLAIGVSGCARSTPVWNNREGPPRVVVTIPALDSFVRNVGDKHVGVICLCTTQGPHHYQYNAEDAILLRNADLLFAVGLTLDEKFADPIQVESHNARLQYVKLGERLSKKSLLPMRKDHDHDEHEEEHGHGHDHEHGEYDPHVWLGIEQAIQMVEIIRDELKKVDHANEADYDKNAAAYIEKLKKLHTDGKKQLADKKDRKIIAFHESLGYFAKSFDLNIVDVIEVTPGTEADQAHTVKLAKKCRDEKVHVIAVEPQYPQETSAKQLKDLPNLDIKFAVVDPLETVVKNELTEDGKELKNSKEWYEKKMRQNLENLARALP